ncbi:hypothetical protein [Spiroplasma sp. ald]|uniref:hypothetical protein n=1 Tax=Spiroplasma sp. ald TaxID=2490849 RepID=UPI0037DCBCFA
MKKILTILGIFGSSAISTTSLLACNTFNGNKLNTSENNKIIKTLKEKINTTLLDNIEDSTKEKQSIKAEAKINEFQRKAIEVQNKKKKHFLKHL